MTPAQKIRRIVVLAVGAVVLIAMMTMSGQLFESNDASHILVIQSPGGELTVHTTPGSFKWQGFGKTTHYRKRGQLFFTAEAAQGDENSTNVGPIAIRFNDAAEARISGSLAWYMPLDEKSILEIHAAYGTDDSLTRQLIQTVAEKAIYMTGPLMSSRESYAERKNDLISLIYDQIQNGVYETTTKQVQQEDVLSGQMKTAVVVELRLGPDGKPLRQDTSPLSRFSIRPDNLSIKLVDYDDKVDAQIAQQQALTQQVQTAIAEAREAEQRKITTEQQGAADAAKAKWEQEVKKAQQVTEAEQRRDVAKLDAEAAALTKQQQILLGEGEAERKRLVMAADGALQPKLDAYIRVNQMYAEALKEMKVPGTVFMGEGGDMRGIDSGAGLIRLLTAKTASDLALDLSVPGQAATKR